MFWLAFMSVRHIYRCMRRRVWIVVISLAVFSVGFVTVVGAVNQSADGSDLNSQPETFSGVVLPIPDNEQTTYRSQAASVVTAGEVPAHASLVATPRGTIVVLTDTELPVSEIEASGQYYPVPLPDIGADGVLVASDVQTTIDGPSVSVEEFSENRGRYHYEVVHLNGHYRHLSFANDVTGYRSPTTFGVVGSQSFQGYTGLPTIAGTARWLTVNASSDDLGGSTIDMVNRQARTPRPAIAVVGFDPAYTYTDRSKVTVVVTPRGQYGLPGPASVYLADSEPFARRIGSLPAPDDLNDYEDDTIRVRAQVLGSQLSTKRTLEQVASCGPDTVATGVTPPGCIPLTYDAAVHTGVVYSSGSSSSDEMIPYVGVSSHDVGQPVKPVSGEYIITARVVATDQLARGLPDGYGLVIEDMERVGSGDGTAAALQMRTEIVNAVRSTLDPTQRVHQQTPTPTSTPTPTPTPTSTRTATPTPTATTNPAPTPTDVVVRHTIEPDDDDEPIIGATFQNETIVEIFRLLAPILVGLAILTPLYIAGYIGYRLND